MTDIKIPLRDMRFAMRELLDWDNHYASLGYEEATPDLVDAILEEGAKFCENVLAPLNQVGDQQGCTWKDGEVTTPEGFKEAYQQFVEAGWPSLAHDPAYGGQGLPPSLGTVMSEMVGTANWSWGMYPGLSHGAMNTLEAHGTEEQKSIYLTKLVEGSWTGTMCLTEPHCGTDLGILRTKAEPNDDGSYSITGTKIFISAGEHDMAENIVHIVLARLPDAPAGTKGISLFIVPKFLPQADGSVGERNAVVCGSLEHKMGIHGNATAVLNFDGAKGFLIGPPNKGLNCMFTFMNTARLGTALQGLAHAEAGFQKSLAYAKERLQMRSLSGPKNPDGPADPIIVHPDVRRMLLTQKAFAEGGRMLTLLCAQQVDRLHKGSEEDKKEADDLLAFLTPIAKAFLTETGFESANLGLQCFGGHGYIAEWGMEQNVRDARISTIYEGTTGVQALDLLGRKVLMSQGELLRKFTKIVHKFCQAEIDNEALAPFVTKLQELNKQWGDLTLQVGAKAMENPDEVGAASVDYLMFSGYVVQAYLWARAAKVANEKLGEGAGEADFYRAKLATARFYYDRILPRTSSHAAAILSGADNLMALDAEHFAF
ncbi:acyl-CoA dehydrogenase C-terminal domain-containing protein [Microbulbifer thermotolerans]|uniref:3-methylmercaptopropionyl-CoA dehydrogenase n=1 Tax=Microbulbifer thermotolerans TaxID=252514 RepID=A0A143HMM2_MICTH|nr:acyl-CoA dehydrogenase C-terminal domain-containing protein [Microbulbifer thermotolerans]AMX02767.1 acyl-CoA dehydrogenase [Microbulbifer thermotolerans]MCX2779625.1 acyl-CoA dehydrogenase C-terminal domain-containing protein [Microbulbifer thermotolerans]MCX2782591.1 acyl-CoA dehydrogenase C-terminal domain-containing protein [Microbulbifer thermotolerans]MCX2794603.1 acyl-CoA dehydrogenase C-terminal domain-containing protein [Microbulbifer thermotolerans]MCX2801431.1 acyl-CoA dehydrogen